LWDKRDDIIVRSDAPFNAETTISVGQPCDHPCGCVLCAKSQLLPRHLTRELATDGEWIGRSATVTYDQLTTAFDQHSVVATPAGVPPTFRTADQIRSDPERTKGIGDEIPEILARVS
jgi:sulfite oxidase